MEMLTLSHIAKRFGEKQVLRDVSFSVPEHYSVRFCWAKRSGENDRHETDSRSAYQR